MTIKNTTKESDDSAASSLRPVAKAIVKAGVVAYDRMKETVSQANAQIADFVQEARAELGQTQAAERKATGPSPRQATKPKAGKQEGPKTRSKRPKR